LRKGRRRRSSSSSSSRRRRRSRRRRLFEDLVRGGQSFLVYLTKNCDASRRLATGLDGTTHRGARTLEMRGDV
jgi:hypothetical protein